MLRHKFGAALDWVRGGGLGAPMSGLHQVLDVDELERRLELRERGAENGKRGLPSADQAVMDDVEQDIVQTVDVARTTQRANTIGVLKALRDNVSHLGVAAELGKLRLLARDALARFSGARAEIGGHLGMLRNELVGRAQELRQFRAEHGLRRPARKASTPMFTYGTLLALILVEALLNGFFFQKGSELGLLGGIGIAVAISFANVGVGFMAGALPARYTNHRRLAARALGFLATSASLVALLGLHLFAAHYRDASATAAPDRVYQAALAGIASNPLGLRELESWFLLLLGALLALVAFVKGYRKDDPYPEYGPMYRRARKAAEEYIAEYDGLFAELDEVREDAVDAFKQALVLIPQQARQADSALAQRARIIQDFENYEGHLEQTANRLLAAYRQANRAHRRCPAPARFDEPHRLDGRGISQREIELIGDGSPDGQPTVSAALQEIAGLQEDVLARYEDLVSQADRPAKLIEELA